MTRVCRDCAYFDEGNAECHQPDRIDLVYGGIARHKAHHERYVADFCGLAGKLFKPLTADAKLHNERIRQYRRTL